MVHAAISGEIDKADFVTEPIFGLRVPTFCPDVPAELLFPRNTWVEQDAYDLQAKALANLFKKNFEQFTLPMDDVRNAGPR
jgi:phosphoenolpyruvate carboxykinase (ATP)